MYHATGIATDIFVSRNVVEIRSHIKYISVLLLIGQYCLRHKTRLTLSHIYAFCQGISFLFEIGSQFLVLLGNIESFYDQSLRTCLSFIMFTFVLSKLYHLKTINLPYFKVASCFN